MQKTFANNCIRIILSLSLSIHKLISTIHKHNINNIGSKNHAESTYTQNGKSNDSIYNYFTFQVIKMARK